MNKNLLIWGTAVILLAVAIYTTNNYEKNNVLTNLEKSTISSPPSEINSDGNSQKAALPSVSGEKAIDFTLTDLDGKKVSLSDYKGKNVYLNFFATWCPPCRLEMPDMEKIYQKYKDKDLVILAIDAGEEKEVVKNFVEKNNYNFKVLLDIDQRVNEKYNISAIPVSVFIDKEGNVVAKKVGSMNISQMEQYIKMLDDKQDS